MPPKRALDAGGNSTAAKRARGQDGGAEGTDDFSNKLAALGLQPDSTLSDVLEYEIPDFSDGYDADLMGGAEDRQFLSTMKEFEREAVLQERREKRIQGQQNAQLQRGLLETLIGEMRQAEKKRGGRRQVKIVQKGPKRKVVDGEDEGAPKPAARGGRKAKVESESEEESSEASAASSSDDSDSDSDSGSSSSDSGSSSGSSEDDREEEEEQDSDASGAPKGRAGKKAAPRRQLKKKPLRRKARAVSSDEDGGSEEEDAYGGAGGRGAGEGSEDEDGQGGPASGRGGKGGQGGLSKRDQMLRARNRKLAGLEAEDDSEEDGGGRAAGGGGGRGARKAAYDEGYGSDEDEDDVEFADEEESSGLLAHIAAQSSQVDSLGSPALEAGQVRPSQRKRRETAAEMLLKDNAPDLRPAEAADMEAVHLRRSDCLKYMSTPVFKEAVMGCYVKWGKEWKVPPSKEDVAAGRATMYRVGRVHRVVHANNPSQGLKPYDPWARDVEGLGKRRDIDHASVIRVTDLQVHVAVGSSTEAAIPGRPNVARLIKFTQLSDQPITSLEWHEYKLRLNEQYDRLGRQEEDRVPTKWEVTRAAGWKDKLKQATFGTNHVDKLLREKEAAQARNSTALARTLNPTRMTILLKERLAECERALAELAAEEERVREKAAEEEANRPLDELDDGLGPAPALGGSGQGAAAARLGSLTTQRISKEKEKAGLLVSLASLDTEELRRRAKHESLVKDKLDAGRNVSVLTNKVNERLTEANDRRMAHAADMERNTDQAAEAAEIDNNPFLRRKTQPVNLFKVNKGAAAAGGAEAGGAAPAAAAPAKAKEAEEAPKDKRADVLAMLDDMDVHAGEEYTGAGGGGVGAGAGGGAGGSRAGSGHEEDAEIDLGLHAPAPAPAPAPQLASPPVPGGTSLAAFRARLAGKA